MLPLIQNTQNSQIYRDRKQIRGYEGMGGGGDEALLLNGYRVSIWGDEKVLEIDSDGDCTTW